MSLPHVPNPNDRKLWTLCALLLLVQLPNATRAWATPLTQAEIDSLLGSKTEFSRQEVAELMSNILNDADEEIERTAQEAAREVAAEDSGEIAVQKSIAESWRKEAARIDGERVVWRSCAIVETVVRLGGMLIYGLAR